MANVNHLTNEILAQPCKIAFIQKLALTTKESFKYAEKENNDEKTPEKTTLDLIF